MTMRHIFLLAAMAATTLGTADLALAKDRPDGPPPECRQNDRTCPPPPERRDRDDRQDEGRRRDDHRSRHARQDLAAPPRPGDSARDGRAFRPSRDSRLAPAPRGQENRVLDDHVVRVDSRTGRILAVVGTTR